MRVRAVGALAVATLVACSGRGGTEAVPPPTPAPRLTLVATLNQPVSLAVRRGDPALYVAERAGRVVAIRDGVVAPRPVLDLTGQVSLGSEQGLLGIAFSPDGRFLYADLTDPAGDTHVLEFVVLRGAVDPSTRRQVLFVDQPYANHNGGGLAFGPDGYLYVGLGDGGSADDPHGNGQSLDTLLGKMLRIDPRPTRGEPYAIPPDNPFVDLPGARPEIWAFGLRNPWRYSFDRATGDLWIGDVGQASREEVDRQPAASAGGENYGWNVMEGSHPFTADGAPGLIPPVYDYGRGEGGCVVIGGYVYRGSAIPALAGVYVFADVCLGQLETLRIDGGEVRHGTLGPTVPSISSFGEDAAGELYVLSLDGGVYRLDG